MNLSDLPNRIRKLMATVNQDDVALVSTLKTAAESFEGVLKTSSDIRYACEQETLATQRGVEIDNLRRDLALEHQKVVSARKAENAANEIIAKIAEAAECEDFADIILARVTALAQQSNAMVRICEDHLDARLKAEAAKLKLNGELSKRRNECDDLRSQLRAHCDLLHEIADALNGPVNTCRDAVPARDWFMEKVEERVASRSYRHYLDIIGESVGKPGLSYKDLVEYFRGLDVTALRKIADKANETETERAKLVGKLADAERHVEARDITIQQLARALGVDQSQSGWATVMLNKAECFRSAFFSKDHKWDKAKTDALQACLSKLGYWPEWNNVDGLQKLTAHVVGLRQELKECQERSIEKNNYISKLEHGYSPQNQKEELEQAHAAINRLKIHLCEEKINLEEAQKGATAARNELDLAVGAIRRMHTKLLEHKEKTGIWPTDGKFRAKLDDIEWCLGVYVGRVIADAQLHEADTRFIADVRDSLSHEILRRNKQ